MAFLQSFTCGVCGMARQELSSEDFPNTCHQCEEDEKKFKRKKHFEELDKLTIEKRLRMVEEWIYDYRPPISISEMRF